MRILFAVLLSMLAVGCADSGQVLVPNPPAAVRLQSHLTGEVVTVTPVVFDLNGIKTTIIKLEVRSDPSLEGEVIFMPEPGIESVAVGDIVNLFGVNEPHAFSVTSLPRSQVVFVATKVK